MWEREYEEMLIQYGAEKEAIPEDRMAVILDQLDELVEIRELQDRIAAILARFSKSGVYANITYDAHAEVYVLIKHDGSRSSHSPYQLDQLFYVPPERLQPDQRLVR